MVAEVYSKGLPVFRGVGLTSAWSEASVGSSRGPAMLRFCLCSQLGTGVIYPQDHRLEGS